MKSAMKNITIKANRTLCGIGALALILSASTAQAASLITNGDFEINTSSDGGNATGWTKVGAYGIYDGVSNLNGPGTVFGSALNSGVGSGYDIDNVSLVAVPEPSAALLGGLGLLALLRRRRGRRNGEC